MRWMDGWMDLLNYDFFFSVSTTLAILRYSHVSNMHSAVYSLCAIGLGWFERFQIVPGSRNTSYSLDTLRSSLSSYLSSM